ncbi:hypothetical protein BAU06_19630 [Bordetella bronchialis]|uniref:Uncharacterized protein n=1 Tax=Bordetella bronchialis TaxID=463025 RepID=A0ABN4R4K6_9BORD|nr:hypothetical protein BAU06_19630 [Bordetella bronchialis]
MAVGRGDVARAVRHGHAIRHAIAGAIAAGQSLQVGQGLFLEFRRQRVVGQQQFRHVVIAGVEPGGGHVQRLRQALDQEEARRVLAALILIHSRAGGHLVQARKRTQPFLGKARTESCLFEPAG